MIDYFLILLIAVILLLITQIVSLIRIRYLIKQLKKALNSMRQAFGVNSQAFAFPPPLKKCQFCKFRKSFIDLQENENPTNFYYRCAINNKPIQLNQSCKKFQPETFYLDKTHDR